MLGTSKPAKEKVAFKSFSSQSCLLLLILQPNMTDGGPKSSSDFELSFVLFLNGKIICPMLKRDIYGVHSAHSVWRLTRTFWVNTMLFILKIVRWDAHCSIEAGQCFHFKFSRSLTIKMNSVSSLPPLFPDLVKHATTLLGNAINFDSLNVALHFTGNSECVPRSLYMWNI